MTRKALHFIVMQSGQTKSGIARELGVQRKTIYNWLSGETKIASKTHQAAVMRLEAKYRRTKKHRGGSK